MTKLKTAARLAILLAGAQAYAAPHPQMGAPLFEGNGCKPNTATAVLSPDGLALSLIFDDYIARAGNGAKSDRKSCNITIPFVVPAGSSISILQADYRGFNSLPTRAIAEFRTSYQFDSGRPHPGRTQKYRGVLNGEFIDTDFEKLSSRCGGGVQLSIRTDLLVKTNDHGDEAFSQIDTTDLTPPSAIPTTSLERYGNRDRFHVLARERDRDPERRRKKDRGVKFLFRVKPCQRGRDEGFSDRRTDAGVDHILDSGNDPSSSE